MTTKSLCMPRQYTGNVCNADFQTYMAYKQEEMHQIRENKTLSSGMTAVKNTVCNILNETEE